MQSPRREGPRRTEHLLGEQDKWGLAGRSAPDNRGCELGTRGEWPWWHHVDCIRGPCSSPPRLTDGVWVPAVCAVLGRPCFCFQHWPCPSQGCVSAVSQAFYFSRIVHFLFGRQWPFPQHPQFLLFPSSGINSWHCTGGVSSVSRVAGLLSSKQASAIAQRCPRR